MNKDTQSISSQTLQV